MQINRQEFLRALNLASKVADKKNVIPILASVKLTLADRLTVSATNLDQSVEIFVDAEGKPFDVRVDAKTLLGVISRIHEDTVEVSVGKEFVIKRKSGNITLRPYRGEEDVLPMDFNLDKVASFPKITLQDTFASVLCGTAEDKVLQGFRNVVQFTFDKGFKCVSTDTQRIVVVEGDAEVHKAEELLLPIYAVRTILAVLNDVGDVTLGQDANHILCVGKDVQYLFRKMSVNYPNVQAFFDKIKFEHNCTVDADAFRQSLELVSTMADPRLRSAQWDLGRGNVILSTKSADVGEISEEVGAEGLVMDDVTKYSLDYTIPIFRQVDGDVELSFAKTDEKDKEGNVTHTYPLQITGKSSVRASYIVQSMRF